MANAKSQKSLLTPGNIVWGCLLVFAIFSILFPLYIMFKYSVADKDSFVTGGRYAAPLWPFKPNLDQYRGLIGGGCFKLTASSLESLAGVGIPDQLMKGLKKLESDACMVKSQFVTTLDKEMDAGFKLTDASLQALQDEGMPARTVEMLKNLTDEKILSESKFLKAVEEQTNFILTEKSLERLQKRDVPENITSKLNNLLNQEFLQEGAFFTAVTEQIGQEQTDTYKKDLLRYVEGEEIGREQLVQYTSLLLEHGFVGWQSGKMGREDSEKYREQFVKEASAGWSIGRKDFLIAGVYSVEIAILTVVFSLLIGAPAAFTLARYRFPGLAVMMFCIVSIRLFPDICSVIPVAEAFTKPPLSLIPAFFQVAMAHTLLSLPYVIYICMGVFKTIPKDLEEQAYILGASKFYAFRHVVIPVALSGMAAAAIYVFLLSWNEFIFAYFILFKTPNVSLPVYLLRILAWTPTPNFLAAISVVLSVPVIIFSFAVQRYMISGMTAGAVK